MRMSTSSCHHRHCVYYDKTQRLINATRLGERSEKRTFGSSEVDYISIFLEHIDLLNGLDRLHIQLLKRRLQFLIIGSRRLVDLLRLATGGSLSSGMSL